MERNGVRRGDFKDDKVPRPVLTVVGLNAFQTIVSQMFVAMKREMPEPRP